MSIQSPDVSFSRLFSGIDVEVPLLNGERQRYTNLDSAASTPALQSVKQAVNRFLEYYSSVHRGMGFKSQLSTNAYEAARRYSIEFLGGSSEEHTCIFVKNATEALNILAHRIAITPERPMVLTSGMEHHSNDLPWRAVAHVVHVGLTPDGRLDEDAFDEILARQGHRIALVSIAGASNVTGYINPLRRLAAKSHAAGALFSVDAAQLAPHRRIDMGALDDPEHFDFVTISAHKMYAPYGSGALVGRKDTFVERAPLLSGGGTVKVVTYEDHVWAETRDEAGSPNVIGAIAMAAAMKALDQIGMDQVARHEAELTRYALEKLATIPGLRIFGSRDAEEASQRLGVIPFEVEGMSHVLVTAVLGYEYGIGARNGRFCAYPYTMHLLGLSNEQIRQANQRIVEGNPSHIPGLVRVSFGLYNTLEDVDRLAAALTDICEQKFLGTYHLDPATGDYIPEGWQVDFDRYFSF